MSKDSEQGVAGQLFLSLTEKQQQRQQLADDQDAEGQVELQQKPEGHPEQGRVGQGVAEVGEPPPDDEGAKRAGNQGDTQAAEQGAS